MPAHNAWIPTDEQRRQARTMAGLGATMEDIARVFEVNVNTVRRRLLKEFNRGQVDANLKVAQSLFEQAVGRPARYDEKGNKVVTERDPVVAAAIFWAKTRMRWTYPKTEVEAVVTINDELAESTDAELIERFKRINREIAAVAARAGLDLGDAEGEGGQESTPDVSSLH